jgi:predicted nucleic acid-binding Zn ribbon protein
MTLWKKLCSFLPWNRCLSCSGPLPTDRRHYCSDKCADFAEAWRTY